MQWQQQCVVDELNRTVDELDARVLRLVRRFPWAFPGSDDGLPSSRSCPARLVDAMMATGMQWTDVPVAPASAAAARNWEDALTSFHAANGLSLLAYSPPSGALVGGDSGEAAAMGAGDAIDLSTTFSQQDRNYGSQDSMGYMGQESKHAEVHAALADLLPITAALMAARNVPVFNTAALTRQQVRDVLYLRQMRQRQRDKVDATHKRLSSLVATLEAMRDEESPLHPQRWWCDRLKSLEAVATGQPEKRYPVSGSCEDTVWRRWAPDTANDGDAKSKSATQVVELSLANRKRLNELVSRWTSAKQRYATLVETANRAAYELAQTLDEEPAAAAAAAAVASRE